MHGAGNGCSIVPAMAIWAYVSSFSYDTAVTHETILQQRLNGGDTAVFWVVVQLPAFVHAEGAGAGRLEPALVNKFAPLDYSF